jgi:hypothetical protein
MGWQSRRMLVQTVYRNLAEQGVIVNNITNQDHNAVWEILENFNFDKVLQVMQALNWTWHTESGEYEVPDLQLLRTEARRLLLRAVEWVRDPDRSNAFCLGVGGFEVQAELDENEQVWVSLKFIVTDWDNYSYE